MNYCSLRLCCSSAFIWLFVFGFVTKTQAELPEGLTDEQTFAALTSPRAAGVWPQPQPVPPIVIPEKAPTLELHAIYKGDAWFSVQGEHAGANDYLGNIDLTATIDGEQLFGVPGSTVFAHAVNDHGGKPNDVLGTVQGMDNIEVRTNTSKILQLWYQQLFLDDRFSLLGGLYDFNSEFYATDASSVFIHPAFGAGAELAQSGRNGPSLFPTTSLAVRARLETRNKFYTQVAAFDGVPGSESNAHGTQIRLGGSDGLLWAMETGVQTSTADAAHYKMAIGVWQYTARFDDLVKTDAEGNPKQRRDNRGAYVLLEHNLSAAITDRPEVDVFFACWGC